MLTKLEKGVDMILHFTGLQKNYPLHLNFKDQIKGGVKARIHLRERFISAQEKKADISEISGFTPRSRKV